MSGDLVVWAVTTLDEAGQALVLDTVARTLAAVAGWRVDDNLREDLELVARDVFDPTSWTACCPMCQEVVCDEDCPLYPVRLARGAWRQ